MSGILGGVANALGALSQGQDRQNQATVQSKLQEAQIVKQQQQEQIQAAIRERQANSDLLKDRLTQSQINDTDQQVQQRAYDVAHPKAQAPVLGTPEYLQAEGQLADMRAKTEAKYRKPDQGPADSIQYTTDPTTGENVVTFVNPRTHQITQSAIAKAKSGAGASSAGAQVPVADMEQRYGELAGAAKSLASGKLKITPGMQTREGLNYANDLGTAGGHPSTANILLSGAFNGLGVGGKGYDDYEQLMTSTRALGDDVAKVFKGRQNEQSVLREIALSRLTPNDAGNPKNVEIKLSRLRHVIALAKLNNPGQSGLEGPATHPSAAPQPSASIGGGFDDLPNAH